MAAAIKRAMATVMRVISDEEGNSNGGKSDGGVDKVGGWIIFLDGPLLDSMSD